MAIWAGPAQHVPRGPSGGAWAVALVSAALVSSLQPALAETLREALYAALAQSRTVMAERARLKAASEDISVAKAGFWPKLSVSGSLGVAGTPDGTQGVAAAMGSAQGPSGILADRSWAYGVTAEQPLSDGFRALSLVRQATANADAGRHDVHALEQATLIEAVAAYLDVLRTREIDTLRVRYVSVLVSEQTAIAQRIKSKDAARTDLSLVEARLAIAQAARAQAQGDEAAASSDYARITGHAPQKLEAAAMPLALMPERLEAAQDEAHVTHPAVQAARSREAAARQEIAKAEGELWPKASLNATYGRSQSTAPSVGSGSEADVTIRVVVPLGQGGGEQATIRKARFLSEARAYEVQDAQLRITSNLATAWGRYTSAQEQLAAARRGLKASEEVVVGIRELKLHGEKTLSDVLNAEQDLGEARVRVVQASYTGVFSAYTLLAARGQLSAGNLEALSASIDIVSMPPAQDGVRADGWKTAVRVPNDRRLARTGIDPWRASVRP